MELKGYQEFKISLVHVTSLEDETPHLSSEITIEDAIEELASKVLSSNINALTDTYNLIIKTKKSLKHFRLFLVFIVTQTTHINNHFRRL